MRLIDADEVMDRLPEENVDARMAVLFAPTVDPVIRCKDCYLRYTSCPMVVRNGDYLTFFTKDDDFCSYGKGEEE